MNSGPAPTDALDAPGDAADAARRTLRAELLAGRRAFCASPDAAAANDALSAALRSVIAPLEPQCLGLYWPLPGEFNAVAALVADPAAGRSALCLPFARKQPPRMEYRRWDGAAPTVVDECGIGASEGEVVVPDVVVVPCLGFTAEGLRLGYGGGYYDRWLAVHPQVTAIGVAWSEGRIDAGRFTAGAHDVPLMLVVTEHGVA